MPEGEAPTALPTVSPAPPLLAALLDAALKKAEEAVEKAERAAVRPKYWLIAGFLFALVGAVLAFALRDSDASVLGVRLQPLGGVLFAVGALTIAAAAIGSIGDGKGSAAASAESIKSIGGLIAVVVGITAVTSLAIVTLTRLDNKASAVAVTSSAFGIISAVIGAYLGIKISSDNTATAGDEATKAALARQKAEVAQQKLLNLTKTLEKVAPERAKDVKAATYHADTEGPQPADPPPGGGSA
ncbi:MAG TPA: hypothetical protein VHU14_07340 [Solirubrobacterales bacterium]|jgi:hypothetical protein|nr:hypothetical protein [Solirubrobacterales bacterium]